MSVPAKFVYSLSTISEVAAYMRDNNQGFFPVCDNKSVIGVVTDRDIVVRGIAKGKSTNLNIAEVMTTGVICCLENDSLEIAADMMVSERIRRLVVLDKNKSLTGVISVDDIAAKAGNSILSNEVLKWINNSYLKFHK